MQYTRKMILVLIITLGSLKASAANLIEGTFKGTLKGQEIILDIFANQNDGTITVMRKNEDSVIYKCAGEKTCKYSHRTVADYLESEIFVRDNNTIFLTYKYKVYVLIPFLITHSEQNSVSLERIK